MVHLDNTALTKNQPHNSHSMISLILKSWPTASGPCPIPDLSSSSFPTEFSKTREIKRIQVLDIRWWQKWLILGRVDVQRGLENLLGNTSFPYGLCKKLFMIPILPLGGRACCFKELSFAAERQLQIVNYFYYYLLIVNYFYFCPLYSLVPNHFPRQDYKLYFEITHLLQPEEIPSAPWPLLAEFTSQ